MALGSNNFQGSITFNVDQAVDEIKRLQDQIDKWTKAMQNTQSPAVFNSFEKMIAAAKDRMVELEQETQKMGESLKGSVKPTGDATQALVNLSRIAQDAPYGFMGIANNLNPMLESFQRLQKESGSSAEALKSMVAGLAGPAGLGLALGVASSLIVAFGSEISAWINQTSELEKAQASFRDEMESNLKTVGTTIATDQALIGVISDVTQSTQARKAALDQLKEAHKGNVELQKTDIDDGVQLIAIINQMSEALVRKAKVEALSKTIGEEYAKQVRLETANLQEQFDNLSGWTKAWDITVSALKNGGSAFGSASSTIKLTSDAIDDNKEKIKQSQATYDALSKTLKSLTSESFKKGDFGITGTSAPKKEKGSKGYDDSKAELESLKEKQKLYKDDIYAYQDYALQILKEEEKLEIARATKAGASGAQLEKIHQLFKDKGLANEKDYHDNIAKLLDKANDEENKKIKKSAEERAKLEMDAAKERLKDIKDTLDEELKASGKSYEMKRAAIQKAMAETMTGKNQAVDPKVIKEYANAYDELDKKMRLVNIEARNDDIKKREAGYKKFAETVSKDVTQGLVTMYDAMQKGQNPLQALGDMIMKLVEQLAEAVLQAIIFQTVMSAFGLGAVGAGGMGSIGGAIGKVFGFADGGVVTQPTLMMAGEGGQSEAIMPLNKLGSMMNNTFAAGAMSGDGGGSGSRGGQFTLKGNDLVLALQRSNYSLNLRRGS